MNHPCLRCGACCAYFRVAFHWSEAEPFLGGTVPPQATVQLDPHRLAMRGTDRRDPRCQALQGQVGASASCTIYHARPSVCRDLAPAWEQGVPSPQCERARMAHGLPPLRPSDWVGPDDPVCPPSQVPA